MKLTVKGKELKFEPKLGSIIKSDSSYYMIVLVDDKYTYMSIHKSHNDFTIKTKGNATNISYDTIEELIKDNIDGDIVVESELIIKL